MVTIIEPPAAHFEAEHRGRYQPVPTSHVGVIVQGSVDLFLDVKGGEDDSDVNTYEVRLLVGPYWRDVQNVVPKVSIDGFLSTNPDEDDAMFWVVHDLRWDTVGELGQSNDELRIRLKCKVVVQGANASIRRLGYYLMASGRRLGAAGLNEPGPVKRQG